MPAVGLSLADDAVAVIELVWRKGERRVGRFGRRLLPFGALVDGALVNASVVAAELRSLREELRLDFVRASISEEKAYLYQTRLPRMESAKVRSALELSLEENVPLAPADALFDFADLPGGESGREMVGVLPRKVAEEYTALLSSAGLTPVLLALEAEAVALALCERPTTETVLVVAVNRSKSSFSVVTQGMVRFTSTVAVGSAHLSEAIGKSLGLDQEKVAAIQKGAPLPQGIRAEEVFFSCANTVSVLKDEMQKILSYWQTHGGDGAKGFSRVILAGDIAGLAEFDDHLSRVFAIPVEAGNVWHNAFALGAYLPPIAFADSFSYAAAVGLSLSVPTPC